MRDRPHALPHPASSTEQMDHVALSKYGFTCQLNNVGYASLFVDGGHADGAPVPLVERGSCLGGAARLFGDVFELPPTLTPADAPPDPPGRDLFHHADVLRHVNGLPLDTVRARFRETLVLRPATRARVEALLEEGGIEPDLVHACVQIRGGDKLSWGEMDPVPMKRYVDAVLRSMPKTIKRPTVFAMTDDARLLAPLREAVPPSWRLQTLTPETELGHDHEAFLESPAERRLEELYRLLADLHVLQQAPIVVGTATSNILRYGFLMHSKAGNADFTSLDGNLVGLS